MALNPTLKQFIETKLARTHKPQWMLPITKTRQAIIAAEHETLRDEAQAYAERLKAADVATRYIGGCGCRPCFSAP